MTQQPKTPSKALVSFFRVLDKTNDTCITASLVAVLIVVLVQIVGRLISMSVPWTEEFSRFAFIWMMFIGIAASMRKSEAARVTILVQKLPRVGKLAAKYLYIIISVAFFAFMIATGLQLVGQQLSMNEIGTALPIPMWLIGVSLPISGVLGILCTFGNLLLDPEILEGGEL